jgi:hypothetical protein
LGDEAVTLSDTTAAASVLTTLDGKTSGAVNAATVTSITGTANELAAVAAEIAAGTITRLNWSASPTSNATVAQANLIDANNGTGVITATISDTAAATLVTLTGTGNAYTVTVTGSASAADLVAIDAKTTVTVNAAGITALTGTATEIDALVAAAAAGTINLTGANFTVNPSTSLTVAQANAVDLKNGTGTITATISDSLAATLATLTGTGNVYTLKVGSGSAAATDLTAIDAATSVLVDATAVTSITGTAAQIAAVTTKVAAGTLSVLNWSAAPTDSMTVEQANLVDASNGSGAITATISDATAATLATLTGTGAYTIAVSGAATAGELVLVDRATSIAVNATGITALTGTAAEINTVATAGAGAINLTGANFTVTPSQSLSVAQANAIDASNGSGQITATISDTSAASLTTLTGKHLYGITVTDSATIAQLTALQSKTDGLLSYSSITDTAANLATVSGSTWTVNPFVKNGTNVTVSDAVSLAELAAINAVDVTGVVTATTPATPTLLSAPNTYMVETTKAPALIVTAGMVASVIDAAGSQLIKVAAGGKLILSGSDGNNNIVFQAYSAGQLDVSRSGTTAIFTDHATHQQIAAIATDATYANKQTITYSDGTHVELTLVGSTLALGGTAITTVGSIV